jgi:hypothetical protein
MRFPWVRFYTLVNDVLPTSSIALSLPSIPPSQHRNPLVGALQWQARERYGQPDADLDARRGEPKVGD